jgi:hypothetical protein
MMNSEEKNLINVFYKNKLRSLISGNNDYKEEIDKLIIFSKDILNEKRKIFEVDAKDFVFVSILLTDYKKELKYLNNIDVSVYEAIYILL